MAAPAADVYNVGTGAGHSVLEVLARVRLVAGRHVPYLIGPRRSGDPAEVVAATDKIRNELCWTARRDLTDMVASAWRTRPHETGRRRVPLFTENAVQGPPINIDSAAR
jgi:UDP-glucose 4-epimerase